jgi:hypothetical protein
MAVLSPTKSGERARFAEPDAVRVAFNVVGGHTWRDRGARGRRLRVAIMTVQTKGEMQASSLKSLAQENVSVTDKSSRDNANSHLWVSKSINQL